MKKINLFLIAYSFFAFHATAQRPLTAQDEKYIKSQAISYIKVFKNNLEELGSSNNLSERERNILVKFTLSYFKKDATMEVMNKKRKNTYQMDYYLKNIVANYDSRFSIVYTTIEISSFNFDDLIPVKDENGNIISYRGSFSYIQGFCAKRNSGDMEKFDSKNPDSYDICEKTWKKGEVIIERRYSPTVGNRWVILLGNIKAAQMKNLKSS